jgi:hypothetical protein
MAHSTVRPTDILPVIPLSFLQIEICRQERRDNYLLSIVLIVRSVILHIFKSKKPPLRRFRM